MWKRGLWNVEGRTEGLSAAPACHTVLCELEAGPGWQHKMLYADGESDFIADGIGLDNALASATHQVLPCWLEKEQTVDRAHRARKYGDN